MSMTKHIHVTDLREVSALKLTCRKCGAAVTVALGALGSLHRCPVCQVDWPHNGAAILGERIRWLSGEDCPVRVEIETALDAPGVTE